jgi:spermidine/putrescine transport system substrate-binding protein
VSEAERNAERLWRAMGGRLSRRELLRRAGRGSMFLGVSAFLAACGVEGQQQEPQPNGDAAPEPLGDPTGELVIANWPLYIDEEGQRKPTVDDFEAETGISVEYREVIDDNESFFGTIQEPLSQGQSTGWDLIVVTDWLIGNMVRLGWLEELHHDRLPNFEQHAADVYRDPSYDPGNRHSIPWQAGITGIGYNPELTGREITSFEDLFDPEFAGRVGMFTEMRDTMNLTLLGMGVIPEDATLEDVERAQERLLEQRDQGIVRAYYGNEYADALARGDLAVTMAWSGDIFQLQFDNPDLEFVVPEEGGILWVDNMAIPAGAEHPADAHEWMNFVYQPEIAAQIAAWVQFITPVPQAEDVLRQQAEEADDPEDAEELLTVADSPLVFPTPEMEERVHSYKVLDEEEEDAWNRMFQEVIQG